MLRHDAGMSHAFATFPWPGFQPDGSLLLPLPVGPFLAGLPATLDWQGPTLQLKQECHVTLLNHACGSAARDTLGNEEVRRLFQAHDWTLHRPGDARVLHQPGTPDAYALIEDVALPALNAFRAAVSRAMGSELPAVHPHVTLFTAAKPEGIGLPDLESLAGMEIARLRMPGIGNRTPPPLPPTLEKAYHDTDFVVTDAPDLVIHIGQHAPSVDALLASHGVDRALLLSACNPYSEASSETVNQLRHGLLCAVQKSLRLNALAAEGRDPTGVWPPETSLLLLGTTPEQEAELLRDYEQHAAVLLRRGQGVALVKHAGHAV